MKIGLRTKLALPLVVSLLALTGVFHFYLADKLAKEEKEHFFKYQHQYMDAVEHVVSRLILSGDLAELYASLGEYKESNDHWLQIAVFDQNNKQLYPLDELTAYSGEYVEKIKHTIIGDERKIGMINVWIDWRDEYEEIYEHIRFLELIALGIFLLVTVISSLWLNRLVRKPVVELEEAAYKIADGDYAAKLPEHSGDELGSLTTAFKRMTLDLKEHEENLVQAKETAEKANNAKSDFLTRVTHELRTPLNAILGFGQLIETDTENPLDEQHKVLMEEIMISGKHLLMLIDNVLELSKIESDEIVINPEPISLNNLVRECIAMTKEMRARKTVEFIEQLPEQDLAIQVDYQRFRDVLIKILSNAVTYNRDGGLVTISVEEKPTQLCLGVTDQGEGISDEDIERLFQPFERLGRENTDTRGIGMGLTISKRLMEMMGGKIEVDSTIGEGTTVWLTVKKSSDAQVQDKIAV